MTAPAEPVALEAWRDHAPTHWLRRRLGLLQGGTLVVKAGIAAEINHTMESDDAEEPNEAVPAEPL